MHFSSIARAKAIPCASVAPFKAQAAVHAAAVGRAGPPALLRLLGASYQLPGERRFRILHKPSGEGIWVRVLAAALRWLSVLSGGGKAASGLLLGCRWTLCGAY